MNYDQYYEHEQAAQCNISYTLQSMISSYIWEEIVFSMSFTNIMVERDFDD
jgi:hypothetical protein